MLDRFYIYDLSVPLGWIGGDRDIAWRVEGFVMLLEQSVIDAAITLSLYLEARELLNARLNGAYQRERFSRKSNASGRRYQELLQSAPGPLSREDEAHLLSAARRDAELEELDTGPPEGYVSRAPKLFAEQFVMALANARRMLRRLASADLSSDPAITRTLAQFDESLPGLVKVRDSLVHWDERVQRKARGEPIVPSGPITVPGIGGDARSMTVSMLNNHTLYVTADDGTAPEIGITVATLARVIELAQDAIDALPWTKDHGMRRYSPEG